MTRNLLIIHQRHHIIHNSGLFLLQCSRTCFRGSTGSLSYRHRLRAVFSFNIPTILFRHIALDYVPDADGIAVDLAFGLVVGSSVLAHEKKIHLHILQGSVLIVVEFGLCDRS